MNELVSIIMPSYNTADFIAESINSVLAQTYTNWELIIVDDCSTDNTDEVVKRFLNDERIKYLKNKQNSGAAISRNRALRLAQGKWIAFLDSDDLWHPCKLELQIKIMKKYDYHFSYTNYCEIDENSLETGIVVTGPKKITKTGMFFYCWPGCLTVMYDRERIGLVQICDIKKNNDYAMWLKVCRKSNCFLLNKELAYYRRGRQGSISTDSIITLLKWHFVLWNKNEKKNSMLSSFFTMCNVFFGVAKKLIFVRRRK